MGSSITIYNASTYFKWSRQINKIILSWNESLFTFSPLQVTPFKKYFLETIIKEN